MYSEQIKITACKNRNRDGTPNRNVHTEVWRSPWTEVRWSLWSTIVTLMNNGHSEIRLSQLTTINYSNWSTMVTLKCNAWLLSWNPMVVTLKCDGGYAALKRDGCYAEARWLMRWSAMVVTLKCDSLPLTLSLTQNVHELYNFIKMKYHH